MTEKMAYTQEQITEFLRAANRDLGSGKYTGDDMIPDYCKAVNIGMQLQTDLADKQVEIDTLRLSVKNAKLEAKLFSSKEVERLKRKLIKLQVERRRVK